MTSYYTPTIEEFHVGFECEVATISLDGDEGWSEELIGPTWFNSIGQGGITESLVELSRFRVKYLDQEDIESLGFEYKGVKDGREFYIDSYEKKADPTWIVINYTTNDHSISLCDEKGWVFFRGTIKNKSELKRILKQVGYSR